MPSSSIPGLEIRGKTYYLRMRVPKEFADVEPLHEINRSLKTRDPGEAAARCANATQALRADWRAKQAGRANDTRKVFEESTRLLQSWGMSFQPIEDLVSGPIEHLLSRIESAANSEPNTLGVAASLGVVDLPDCSLSEMSERMPALMKDDIRAKNPRQLREWSGNFRRAAREFGEVIGERTIITITEQDATNYQARWVTRVKSGEVTANYANKQLRYVRQMIDAHFDDIRLPGSKRLNYFEGSRVSKRAYDPKDNERRKLPLPEAWIRETLVRDRVLEELNSEASDVAIVAAVGGCRQSEVYDVPTEDIHLDHQIPHFEIRVEPEGPEKREIKNQPSTRTVVLLGPALEAMRRHPEGFPRFRGRASYSNSVNKFLRENDLFPKVPADALAKNKDARYVISGTRHAYEDRMIAAKIGNEERAFLMGHSVGKVRGRPVYGSDLELPMRALLQEMVAFETADWKPRPIAKLWSEIDRLLEEKGHRIA